MATVGRTRRLSYDLEGTLMTIESEPDETGAFTIATDVPR